MFFGLRKTHQFQSGYVISSGGPHHFAKIECRVDPDPTTERVDFRTGEDFPGRWWFPFILKGAESHIQQCAHERIRLCSIGVDITQILDHPTDTNDLAMTRVGERLIQDLLSKLEHICVENSVRTVDVMNLAREIQQKTSLENLPILADALEEAGCEDELILEHCRLCTEHGESCWVVEFLLIGVE